jgi:hypothetical protein
MNIQIDEAQSKLRWISIFWTDVSQFRTSATRLSFLSLVLLETQKLNEQLEETHPSWIKLLNISTLNLNKSSNTHTQHRQLQNSAIKSQAVELIHVLHETWKKRTASDTGYRITQSLMLVFGSLTLPERDQSRSNYIWPHLFELRSQSTKLTLLRIVLIWK